MTPEEEELERKLAGVEPEVVEPEVVEPEEPSAYSEAEPEEPVALMSPEEVSRMERLKDWSEELSKRLGGGMTVNSNGVFIVPSTATEKDIGRALPQRS